MKSSCTHQLSHETQYCSYKISNILTDIGNFKLVLIWSTCSLTDEIETCLCTKSRWMPPDPNKTALVLQSICPITHSIRNYYFSFYIHKIIQLPSRIKLHGLSRIRITTKAYLCFVQWRAYSTKGNQQVEVGKFHKVLSGVAYRTGKDKTHSSSRNPSNPEEWQV